jgi:cell division protein FtsI (penicillin-binding protein 3)
MLFSSPKDSSWASRQLLWNSIGYERKMAPIQMLTFYNAIANDGKMVKPTLQKGHTEVLNEQIAKKENIAEIQHALYNVVYRGLGRLAGSSLVPVAGKTGTALTDSRFEDEGITEFHVSFCGYFPADAPKYSIIVSMNKYGLPASGGGMAGVVFHDIVEWMLCHDMPTVLIVDEEKGDTAKLTEEMIK